MNDLHITPQKENENNRQYARRILYDNIISLNLKPNTVINENEIGQLLSISRTPVHEAVLQLKSWNLIDVYPQKASVVSRINLGLSYEAYFLRGTVEPRVYEIACQGVGASVADALKNNLEEQRSIVEGNRDYHSFFVCDNAFHKIIYDATHKSHIWEAIESVSSHFYRMRHFDGYLVDNTMQLSFEDHVNFYYCVVSGSFQPILERYPDHLSFYQFNLPRLLEEKPEYFEI